MLGRRPSGRLALRFRRCRSTTGLPAAESSSRLRPRAGATVLRLRTPRAFSSGTDVLGGTGDAPTDAPDRGARNNRVPVALYRQLLSWCRRYDDVPFHGLPPVALAPPQVDPIALKWLKRMRTFLDANEIEDGSREGGEGEDDAARFGRRDHPADYAMYGGIDVKDNLIAFPEVKDARELRAVIRSVFWLNNERTVADAEGEDADGRTEASDVVPKERVSLAFDALKSCNELAAGELDAKVEKRKLSVDVRRGRDGGHPAVEYHVGQVVRNEKKKWRGVVVGWFVVQEEASDRLTSLTTKPYATRADEDAPECVEPSAASDARVQYTVLVDFGDANGDRYEVDEGAVFGKTISLEGGDDLSPVEDPCLQRIHNGLIKQYFAKFDAKGHYVPNDNLSYLYPLDRFSRSKYGADICYGGDTSSDTESNNSPTEELEKSRAAIVGGVREIGRRLLVPLSGREGKSEDEASLLISSMESSLRALADDDPSSQAISTLAKLHQLHVKLNALLWARNANRRQKGRIHYSLGQIVKHKLYGFRGVIVAWDPKPRVDVSNWDGLVDVDSPQEKPFYHIRPDADDAARAFGGPRDFRYVCQDNLEASPHCSKPLELSASLDPDEWKFDYEGGRYVPSPELKFMYAEDLEGDQDALVASFQNLRQILTECLLKIRDGDNPEMFSMDDLFCQLQFGAESLEDATIVLDMIKEVWKEHSDLHLRQQLDSGITQLVEGKHKSALETFSSILSSDPLYGEAWNKKATVHYMLGEKEKSINTAEEALKLDQRNFQALAGLGLIEMDLAHYEKAIGYFRECLSLNPWLVTVSSMLARCMRKKETGPDERTGTEWRWPG